VFNTICTPAAAAAIEHDLGLYETPIGITAARKLLRFLAREVGVRAPRLVYSTEREGDRMVALALYTWRDHTITCYSHDVAEIPHELAHHVANTRYGSYGHSTAWHRAHVKLLGILRDHPEARKLVRRGRARAVTYARRVLRGQALSARYTWTA
jgi:hypothetical protein